MSIKWKLQILWLGCILAVLSACGKADKGDSSSTAQPPKKDCCPLPADSGTGSEVSSGTATGTDTGCCSGNTDTGTGTNTTSTKARFHFQGARALAVVKSSAGLALTGADDGDGGGDGEAETQFASNGNLKKLTDDGGFGSVVEGSATVITVRKVGGYAIIHTAPVDLATEEAAGLSLSDGEGDGEGEPAKPATEEEFQNQKSSGNGKCVLALAPLDDSAPAKCIESGAEVGQIAVQGNAAFYILDKKLVSYDVSKSERKIVYEGETLAPDIVVPFGDKVLAGIPTEIDEDHDQSVVVKGGSITKLTRLGAKAAPFVGGSIVADGKIFTVGRKNEIGGMVDIFDTASNTLTETQLPYENGVPTGADMEALGSGLSISGNEVYGALWGSFWQLAPTLKELPCSVKKEVFYGDTNALQAVQGGFVVSGKNGNGEDVIVHVSAAGVETEIAKGKAGRMALSADQGKVYMEMGDKFGILTVNDLSFEMTDPIIGGASIESLIGL